MKGEQVFVYIGLSCTRELIYVNLYHAVFVGATCVLNESLAAQDTIQSVVIMRCSLPAGHSVMTHIAAKFCKPNKIFFAHCAKIGSKLFCGLKLYTSIKWNIRKYTSFCVSEVYNLPSKSSLRGL